VKDFELKDITNEYEKWKEHVPEFERSRLKSHRAYMNICYCGIEKVFEVLRFNSYSL
jgi:hypothetical protein